MAPEKARDLKHYLAKDPIQYMWLSSASEGLRAAAKERPLVLNECLCNLPTVGIRDFSQEFVRWRI